MSCRPRLARPLATPDGAEGTHMNVTRIRALRGPNLWSRNTAIEAIVECTAQECCLTELPGFEERLRQRFPEIGPLQALRHDDAVSLAHVLEFAALGL